MAEQYQTEDLQDTVVVDGDNYTTYTGGTRDPLYRGSDETKARESLAMIEEEWAELLAGDPIELDGAGRAVRW